MRTGLRRTTVLACIVGSLAIVAGGAVAANGLGSGAGDQQAIIDDAAQRLGVSPEKLSNALRAAVAARIDAAVTAGDLTPEQAARLKERSANGPLPFGFAEKQESAGPVLGVQGFAFGIGGDEVRGGPSGDIDSAAEFLGLSREQLHEQLNSGKTLADIAKAKGKPEAGLVDAMLAPLKAKLDAAVKAGDLTRAEATNILAKAREHSEEMLDAEIRLGEKFHDKGFGVVKPGFGFGGGAFGPGPLGDVESAAGFLGLSLEQLQTQLNSGKTLADVAKAEGKPEAGLVDAMLAPLKTKLDAAVEAGDMTRAEADDVLAAQRKHTEAMLDAEIKAGECRKVEKVAPWGGTSPDDPVPAPLPAEPDVNVDVAIQLPTAA